LQVFQRLFECSEHLSENRGVPGSSPGLAIEVFYNRQRRHSTLGQRSPFDYETSTLRQDGAEDAASRLASHDQISLTATPTAHAA
jgi:hypothetical protein